MNSPRVSVVMPVWNASKYLTAAMHSIAGQSFSDYELIIVNDGSTDETETIIAEFARLDSRIILVQNKSRLGMGHVFNQGIFAARGEYIARMDGDDISHRDRFMRQVSYLDAHPKVVVVGGQIELIDSRGVVTGARAYPIYDHELRRAMARVSPFAHPVTMFRREVAINLRGYDVRYAPAEDLHFWVRFASLGLLANLPETLLRYRVHGGSVTAKHGMRMQWQSLRVRLLAWRRYGLPMTPADMALAVVQLGAAPLPFRVRVALFDRYRESLSAVRHDLVSAQFGDWLDSE